jgi:hypothetical protein
METINLTWTQRTIIKHFLKNVYHLPFTHSYILKGYSIVINNFINQNQEKL